jgi:hypothetical protein
MCLFFTAWLSTAFTYAETLYQQQLQQAALHPLVAIAVGTGSLLNTTRPVHWSYDTARHNPAAGHLHFTYETNASTFAHLAGLM